MIPTIQNFIQALNEGVSAWERAGQIIVSLLKNDPKVFDKIIAEDFSITRDTLEIFYHIGTRTIYPKIVLLPNHIFSHVRHMTYETQKKLLTEPIQIVTRMVGYKPVIIRKGIAKLSCSEARISLCHSGNRTIDWQIKTITAIPKYPKNLIPKLPSKTPQELQRVPEEKGRYVLRRNAVGAFILERTMAVPYNIQRVILSDGQATISICAYK